MHRILLTLNRGIYIACDFSYRTILLELVRESMNRLCMQKHTWIYLKVYSSSEIDSGGFRQLAQGNIGSFQGELSHLAMLLNLDSYFATV